MLKSFRVRIPDSIEFSALKLARDPVTGHVGFAWTPIEAICAASGIDVALFRDAPEDNVAGLIVAWYAEHRAHGGAQDLVAEQLLAEVQAEDALGAERVQAGPGTHQ